MEISEKDWDAYADTQSKITQTAEKKMESFLQKSEELEWKFDAAASERQWVAFRLEERNGKISKVPVNPKTGRYAMTNNPATWGTLEEAQQAIQKFGTDGVGFVFDNGYFGIDLDDVIDPQRGTIKAWAQEIIDAMGSYTEISPSGRGVHIIAKGNPVFDRNKNAGIEMYAPTRDADGKIRMGRYFTVTGNTYGMPQPIAVRTEEAMDVWSRYINGRPALSEAVVPIGAGNTVDYAYALATKYGEASASLACEMYDSLAAAQGVMLPPAEPAATATYQETAKAIIGTEKNRRNSVPQTVGRLVKQAGADTMLKNAARDGAEWAWIPRGDTCAFCIMLASNGWQRASKKAIKKGHAEHIHANCDCTYAVRFDPSSDVAGYEPEKYLEMYESASSGDWRAKRDAMQAAINSRHREAYNERKRAEYAARRERAGKAYTPREEK